MAFPVVAMEPDAFDAWLEARNTPSAGVDAGTPGRELFLRTGCGDCHRGDGTRARGTSGPDLSHVGSRLTIGAGLLANDTATLVRFVSHAAAIKPGSRMPAYPQLSSDDLNDIAAWLKGLQ